MEMTKKIIGFLLPSSMIFAVLAYFLFMRRRRQPRRMQKINRIVRRAAMRAA